MIKITILRAINAFGDLNAAQYSVINTHFAWPWQTNDCARHHGYERLNANFWQFFVACRALGRILRVSQNMS